MSDGFITTKQAAVLTGYRSDYVGQLAREGRISSTKKGKQRLVEVASLFEYVSTKNSETSQEIIEPKDVTMPKDERPVNINLQEEDGQESSAVNKKIVSPWISVDNSNLNVKTDKTFSSTIESKPVYSSKQFGAKLDPQRLLDKGPAFELLPAVSATAVVLAALVFMFSVGTMVTSEKQLAANYENVASVNYSKNAIREVAKGWYQIVNNL